MTGLGDMDLFVWKKEGSLGAGELTCHPRCFCKTPRRGQTSQRNLSCLACWHRTALWRHPERREGEQEGEVGHGWRAPQSLQKHSPRVLENMRTHTPNWLERTAS